MDAGFWHQRWQDDVLGFHEAAPNGLLTTHFNVMGLAPGNRIFLPLCGKTRDIGWLLSQGYRVAGAELSEIAIRQLFLDLNLHPEIAHQGELTRFSADGIDIFVGDIFALTAEVLGPVDAVYDRAALVALPEETRKAYADHMTAITATAPQFLICFEYDQDEMPGPPFSVIGDEIQAHYDAAYDVTSLARIDVPGKLKGICAATENAWRLAPRQAG